MNRGRRKENIFLARADYNAFIRVLYEAVTGWNLQVSAYCLMSNHYHLLVQTPDGNLSRCMRHINGVYTQRFNRHHKEEGQLFRGRYKAVLIDADNHLLEVLRYIHRNPVRAGISATLKDYPWSSHHGYMSRAKKWSWLYKDYLLSMLTEKKGRQKSAYVDFVTQGESDRIKRFYGLKNLSPILGGDHFKDLVREKFAHLSFREEIPESKSLAPPASDVISAVCNHYKVPENEIFTSKRGTVNLPRDIAIYLVRHYCRETLPAVGQHFGITNYSTVSSAVERVKARMTQEKTLHKDLERIRDKLYKSQQQT
jgi:REP element-mobilizing transposase RayT